ncbi:uncharacterized protein LOC103359358 isoform X1 [Stegastes partitus]|uniref:Uncharacterized protein LOC103359358 isoform X1 n=1 Tax=Stegastes partitus TaxID=144197 RepID=A0A9Y4JUS4_9TELE|nr:PREDICTED: uncharacterized protein LOC103359358 isoform X1 [Stegastes partitus]XP_008282893.1 PREDICTED: uncharacterized protein LOC103359358 isoform X1 [Stegastes partitus]XP_008282894.1 PREDICTED: uncharacterized protein LOC103359358 isoform X1 [Stegastes partitus]
MEEAYNELYQQFLRLRSLCLRQAALLHQLTAALQKQQGASVPNGELSDMMSIPVQCTHEIPVYPHEKPQPRTAATQNPAAQCGIGHLSRNVGTFSDLLAEDMSKLCVDMTSLKADQTATFLLTLDSSRCREASSSESKNQGKNHPGGDRAPCTVRVFKNPSCILVCAWFLLRPALTSPSSPVCLCEAPVADNPSQAGGLMSLCGGALMSDVALQSHVCEFCQAVFPGDTTTRGEFLRHLYTHVT